VQTTKAVCGDLDWEIRRQKVGVWRFVGLEGRVYVDENRDESLPENVVIYVDMYGPRNL
jgi:hypothetical protein